MPTRRSGASPVACVGVWITVIVGSVGTIGGIYYSFVTPWIDVPPATWMTWVGGISLGMFVLGFIVYFFGRRSAHKTSQEDSLAHLAVFDLNKTRKRRTSQMTMESTMLSTPDTGDSAALSAGSADRAEIESAAANHLGLRIRHSDTEIRDDPAGRAGQDTRS